MHYADSDISRRSFLKGAAAFAALVPMGGLLAACSASNSSSTSPSSTNDQDADSGSPSPSTSTAQGGAAAASGSVLVAYYSAQGHTQAVAEAVADELGADLFVITPAQPYSDEDLNYNDDSSRVSTEHNDPDGRHVELETITPEGFDGYDTVLIGYPIWWGEAAWVVDDFVSGNDFDGKTVIPFCTSASSPLGQSGSLLADMAGSGDWQEGMRFRSSASESDVRAWAQGLRA